MINEALHAKRDVPLPSIVKEEYRNYQIYTLMDRAIPYLQDGLKPVQRRILYMLWKNQSKGLMKVSSATGMILTLHPHGPQSIEAAIVNLAQDYTFSNNYPLIDKKGYFGERLEPVAAASRYIECKLGKIAEILLFDDLNQVTMVPNYDERLEEPLFLLPKLPLMLLNGAEGIGTGFSSQIPSFHHSDIVKSIIQVIKTGKPKNIKPFVRYYNQDIKIEDGKFIFSTKFEKRGEKIHLTEIPRGFDGKRINKHLIKFIEKDELKDFIDNSVDNLIDFELVFKKGATPELSKVEEMMGTSTSLVPNYTLISDRGVKIFDRPEQIITLFTAARLKVVKRRYELLAQDTKNKLNQNNEIIRFIKDKHYQQAEKQSNRKTFIDYLNSHKFQYAEYLADMAIYRMTQEEVKKRQLLIQEDTKKLAEYQKIMKDDELVKDKLVEELESVDKSLNELCLAREREKREQARGSQLKKKVKSE